MDVPWTDLRIPLLGYALVYMPDTELSHHGQRALDVVIGLTGLVISSSGDAESSHLLWASWAPKWKTGGLRRETAGYECWESGEVIITLRPREPSKDRVNSKSKEKQKTKKLVTW